MAEIEAEIELTAINGIKKIVERALLLSAFVNELNVG